MKARRDLLEGNDIRRGFHYFQLFERGKLRDICSVHFSERVPQKSLSQNALVPALTPTFIRNNTANTKGRGTGDAIDRLKKDLVKHYRKHGREGYILLIDFKSYFANIAHGPLKEIVARSFDDPRIVKLTHDLIDACGEKGLGLGSEPNQILAVAFPSAIDHFVTEMLGVEGYGRYMDDSYCIHTDKAYLEIVAGLIEWKCGQLGIEINRKKTHIVKLSHGFTWLKKKFSYGENGRIVIRPCRDSITRERRKLKKMRRMVDEGRLTVEQVERSYQSWRGSMLKLDAHRTVLNMDALYRSLFGDDLENVRGGGVAVFAISPHELFTRVHPPTRYHVISGSRPNRAAFLLERGNSHERSNDNETGSRRNDRRGNQDGDRRNRPDSEAERLQIREAPTRRLPG